MRPATHCPSCNTPIGPQPTNFCPHCGYPLLAAAPPTVSNTVAVRQARGTKQAGFYFPSQGASRSGKTALPPTRRKVLTLSIGGVSLIALVLVSLAVVLSSPQPATSRSGPAATRVSTAVSIAQITVTPQSTGTPRATADAEPTAQPRSPAQQMAQVALGSPVKANNTLVQTFMSEMSQMQPICQMHQFQIAALIMATWRRIKAEGGKTSLPTVAQMLEGAVSTRAPAYGPDGCRGLADQYVRDQRLARQTGATDVVESQALTPTTTPVPDLLVTWGPDTYTKVSDHPNLYRGAPEIWTCVIAKFLGDDPNNPGNSLIGCWEYKGSYDGFTGDGEVILSVPPAIDTNSMDTGDYIRVEGKVDQPIQGTNGYGAPEIWPQLDVLAIEDDGPNPPGSTP